MEELARNANPDEINIAEDDDEDIQPVEGRMIVFLNKNKIYKLILLNRNSIGETDRPKCCFWWNI